MSKAMSSRWTGRRSRALAPADDDRTARAGAGLAVAASGKARAAAYVTHVSESGHAPNLMDK